MAKKKDYIIDKSKRKEKFKKSKKSSNCGLEKKCDKFITCNPAQKKTKEIKTQLYVALI